MSSGMSGLGIIMFRILATDDVIVTFLTLPDSILPESHYAELNLSLDIMDNIQEHNVKDIIDCVIGTKGPQFLSNSVIYQGLFHWGTKLTSQLNHFVPWLDI